MSVLWSFFVSHVHLLPLYVCTSCFFFFFFFANFHLSSRDLLNLNTICFISRFHFYFFLRSSHPLSARHHITNYFHISFLMLRIIFFSSLSCLFLPFFTLVILLLSPFLRFFFFTIITWNSPPIYPSFHLVSPFFLPSLSPSLPPLPLSSQKFISTNISRLLTPKCIYTQEKSRLVTRLWQHTAQTRKHTRAVMDGVDGEDKGWDARHLCWSMVLVWLREWWRRALHIHLLHS